MSVWAELAELLAKKVAAGVDAKATAKVGEKFLEGAELPGTFERGRQFAKTDAGLAAQFDWGVPQRVDPIQEGFHPYFIVPRPGDTKGAYAFGLDAEGVRKAEAQSAKWSPRNGMTPHMDDIKGRDYYTFSTGNLRKNSGEGTSAYPTLYGLVSNRPGMINIKDDLTAINAQRNNAHMANAIMRDPSLGERLWASPEQFNQLPGVDVRALKRAGAETQVGSLQTEGALSTLRRVDQVLGDPRMDPAVRSRLLDSTQSLSSHASPAEIAQLARLLQQAGTPSLGERSLRRAGIVRDVLEDRPVNPEAFKRLEFSQGGLAQACACGALKRA